MIQMGGVYTTSNYEEGIVLQKYRNRNGRCFKYHVQGSTRLFYVKMGKIAPRHPLAISQRGQPSQFHMERIFLEFTNECQARNSNLSQTNAEATEDQFLCFRGGGYDCQRALVI